MTAGTPKENKHAHLPWLMTLGLMVWFCVQLLHQHLYLYLEHTADAPPGHMEEHMGSWQDIQLLEESMYREDLPSFMQSENCPRLALLLFVPQNISTSQYLPHWMAVANRKAYAVQHGFHLYLVADPLGSGEDRAWETLAGLQAVLMHTCAPWVWLSDVDTFIMTPEVDILDIAYNPLAFQHPVQHCSPAPDVIAADACLTAISTRSVLWRNSNWTRQLVADAVHPRRGAAGGRDLQAVMLNMYEQPGIKQHFCIVKQRAITAFSGTGCHDASGAFKKGDLMMHLPGGLNNATSTNSTSKWLQAIPLLPRTARVSAREVVYVVKRFDTSARTRYGRQVDIRMRSEMMDANTPAQMQTDMALYVEPQLQDFDNWGWPLSINKAIGPAAAPFG